MSHIIVPPDVIPDPSGNTYLINGKCYRFVGYTEQGTDIDQFDVTEIETCMECQCAEIGWPGCNSSTIYIDMSAGGPQTYWNRGYAPLANLGPDYLEWILPDIPPGVPQTIVNVRFYAAKGHGKDYTPCHFAASIIAIGAPYGFAEKYLTDLSDGPIVIPLNHHNDAPEPTSGTVTISLER